MKIPALALIFTAFCLGGQLISLKLEQRVKMLEKIYLLFSQISAKIHFTADSAKDIFVSLERCENYEILPFVGECSRLLSQGKSFNEAWSDALKQKENTRSLKKEDVELLMSFSSSFGATDVSGQISNCALHMELVKEKTATAKRDFDLYSKPVKGICALIGTAIFVFFI